MIDHLHPSWNAALAPVLQTEAAQQLDRWLEQEEAAGKAIFPPRAQRWRAFELTPLEEVRVVILGQDPYHGEGQSHGLCFSVPDGVRPPPSLVNIRKELASDLGDNGTVTTSGNLERWARQGVLLLNTCLTVEAGLAGSHSGKGWEAITDAAVAAVAQREAPSVFILWGNHAQRKAAAVPELAPGGRHLVIASVHPSPLSARRGFFGSKPFSRANAFLEQHGRGSITW